METIPNSVTQNNRIIVNLTTHLNEEDIQSYLKRFSYFFSVQIIPSFIDMTGIRPQDPVPNRPQDLYPDRAQDFLMNMSDKVSLSHDQKGVLAVLFRNDPRRPGEKKYHIVFIFWASNKPEFEAKINQLQNFLTSKGIKGRNP
jgi:hypothetical protein